jgi:hypothetical protein
LSDKRRSAYIERRWVYAVSVCSPRPLLVIGLVGCGSGADREVLPIQEDFSTCNAPEINEEQEVGCVNGEGRFLFKDTETRVGALNALLLPRSMASVTVASDVTLHSVSGNTAKQLVWGGVVCTASQGDKPAKGYEFVVLPRTHELSSRGAISSMPCVYVRAM